MEHPRITSNPEILTGKPCIRGMRFPVARLFGLLASGMTEAEILAEYDYLEAEDFRAAYAFAADLADDEIIRFGAATALAAE